jgi:tetratricopeptide (TPR) repeat protein
MVQKAWLMIAKTGHEGAKQMAAFAAGEIAGCLESMGQLIAAETAYENTIAMLEGFGDRRHVAVAKANMGILRMRQRRYADALKSHFGAKEIFEELAEPSSVATSWHNIGLVFGKVGRFEDAENAYQEALAIEVRNGNKKGEATALLNLGNLYSMLGRNHDAASFLRQAIGIREVLQDTVGEGHARSNLANILIRLEDYEDARGHLNRALDCKGSGAREAERWNTFEILSRLETAVGDIAAAASARERAMNLYLAFRRSGGESHTPGARLCGDVMRAFRCGNRDMAHAALDQVEAQKPPGPAMALISALRKVLRGESDPSLAINDKLNFRDAVELQMLIDALRTEGKQSR